MVVDTGEDQRGGDGAQDEEDRVSMIQTKVRWWWWWWKQERISVVESVRRTREDRVSTIQTKVRGWGKYPLWWWWWWMQERISVVVVVVEEEDAERISVVVVVVVVDSGCDGVGGGSIGSRCFCETARMI